MTKSGPEMFAFADILRRNPAFLVVALPSLLALAAVAAYGLHEAGTQLYNAAHGDAGTTDTDVATTGEDEGKTCPRCQGGGMQDVQVYCKFCEGSGYDPYIQDSDWGPDICRICLGTGRAWTRIICKLCGGDGRL